jgi:hypothetical protein
LVTDQYAAGRGDRPTDRPTGTVTVSEPERRIPERLPVLRQRRDRRWYLLDELTCSVTRAD